MYINESLKLAMPTRKYIDKYKHSEDINGVMEAIFMMTNEWYDAPTACWAVTTIYALLQEAEKCREHRGTSKVRVVITLPEGEGYNIYDFCPHKRTVHSNNFEKEDQGDGEWESYKGFVERNGVYMSKRLNEILYVSEWENCDFHKDNPELTLVHDQDEVEVVDFSEAIDALNNLSIYKD